MLKLCGRSAVNLQQWRETSGSFVRVPQHMQTVTLHKYFLRRCHCLPHERLRGEQREDAPTNICLQKVLTCGHQSPAKKKKEKEKKAALKSSALPSGAGLRGSADNQNFGGGLDGVPCLVTGRSIPGLCATAETEQRSAVSAAKTSNKTEERRRLSVKKLKNKTAIALSLLSL